MQTSSCYSEDLPAVKISPKIIFLSGCTIGLSWWRLLDWWPIYLLQLLHVLVSPEVTCKHLGHIAVMWEWSGSTNQGVNLCETTRDEKCEKLMRYVSYGCSQTISHICPKHEQCCPTGAFLDIKRSGPQSTLLQEKLTTMQALSENIKD